MKNKQSEHDNISLILSASIILKQKNETNEKTSTYNYPCRIVIR